MNSLQLLLCKQEQHSQPHGECLDIWLLSSSVYWTVSMMQFGNLASDPREFGCEWVFSPQTVCTACWWAWKRQPAKPDHSSLADVDSKIR